jgi:ubiquinone/menaquinone biosynthesis C-methylase UbiE
MSETTPDSTTSFIGSIPKYYDQYLCPLLFDEYALDLARRVHAPAAAAVLETAAGTGIASRRLRDELPADARLLVTDLNDPMLEIARAKFEPGEQVEFRPADATQLEYAEASFDAVACQFSLMFFPDKLAAVREAARVLKPGGAFVFNVWDSRAHNDLPRIVDETLVHLFGQRRPPFLDTPYGFYRIDEIKGLLGQAGFGRIEISILPKIARGGSARDAALGYILGTPTCLQIAERGEPGLNEVVDEVEGALREALGAGAIAAKMQAIVFEAYL